MCWLLVVWPWRHCLKSQNLSFCIYKMGVILPPHTGLWKLKEYVKKQVTSYVKQGYLPGQANSRISEAWCNHGLFLVSAKSRLLSSIWWQRWSWLICGSISQHWVCTVAAKWSWKRHICSLCLGWSWPHGLTRTQGRLGNIGSTGILGDTNIYSHSSVLHSTGMVMFAFAFAFDLPFPNNSFSVSQHCLGCNNRKGIFTLWDSGQYGGKNRHHPEDVVVRLTAGKTFLKETVNISQKNKGNNK